MKSTALYVLKDKIFKYEEKISILKDFLFQTDNHIASLEDRKIKDIHIDEFKKYSKWLRRVILMLENRSKKTNE